MLLYVISNSTIVATRCKLTLFPPSPYYRTHIMSFFCDHEKNNVKIARLAVIADKKQMSRPFVWIYLLSTIAFSIVYNNNLEQRKDCGQISTRRPLETSWRRYSIFQIEIIKISRNNATAVFGLALFGPAINYAVNCCCYLARFGDTRQRCSKGDGQKEMCKKRKI